jgi:prepilin-type N-terminal cleavage/methylation domain-containing protein
MRLTKRFRGFSLLEMMVTIALGLVLLLGIGKVYTSYLSSGMKTFHTTNLNKILSTTIAIMGKEIRAAHEPDTTLHILEYDGRANSCILFQLDANDTPGIQAGEDFGFRLITTDGIGRVQTKVSGSELTNCESGEWRDITAHDNVNINALSFDRAENIITIGLKGAQTNSTATTPISRKIYLRNSERNSDA